MLTISLARRSANLYMRLTQQQYLSYYLYSPGLTSGRQEGGSSSIPTFIDITEARQSEINFLDRFIVEPGAFYVMDRGYMDFGRFYRITTSVAFFVTKLKSSIKLRRRYSHPKDSSKGILSDQTVVAKEPGSFRLYPAPFSRVRFHDPEEGETFAFLTNNFEISALTVADLYMVRWQIELFFKWIKQHLQIKRLFGHTMNAVKTQIWIAVSVRHQNNGLAVCHFVHLDEDTSNVHEFSTASRIWLETEQLTTVPSESGVL